MTQTQAKFQPPEGWAVSKDGERIYRKLETKDFMEAVGLVNRIAEIAEDLNHHPDLHIESWNHLRIETYSHDVGKLTDRDRKLAGKINEILGTS